MAKAKKEKEPNKKLVIVESPSKAKTINKYLGSEYLVLASKGHLIDLPKSKLGVDLEKNFEPQYIPIRGKASIIKELKKAAQKSSAVYLAADPDREGEAIGWHIRNFLSTLATVPTIYRLRLNEITKSAIEEAIQTPSEVDLNMVNAQQARRVLDRLVGYGISPLLWKNIRRGLSAGRVQSVALRLIYEREKEIEGFKPEEYWTLEADFTMEDGRVIRTKLAKVSGEKPVLKTEADTQALIARIQGADFKVSAVLHRDKSKKPPMPFTTSKLQQEAYKQLRFGARKTMSIAQGLYEGIEMGSSGPVGLITYMRTDSKRVSPEAKTEAAKFILETYGDKFQAQGERDTSAKGKIQDAHEAIRPTSVYRTPEQVKSHLTPEQFKLYKLIWEDFVASQMSNAQYRETSVEISGNEVVFRATGTETVFEGFTKVYEESADEDKKEGPGAEGEDTEEVNPNKLAGISEGQKAEWKGPQPEQHFTQPPPRYTDASMVKTLEEMGIGRPSTYAPTLETIQARHYVKKEGGRFFLAELGQLVLELLMKNFPTVLDYEFTAKMESELDQVEAGEQEWRKVIGDFYTPFKDVLAEAEKMMGEEKSKIEVVTDIPCEKCGQMMIVKWGRHGKFLACSKYPECQNTKSLKETTDGSIQVEEDAKTDEKCPKCGADMVVKRGRFGKFLACSKYPECKTAKPIPLGIKCPLGCGGEVVSRGSRRGVFYGCNKYPDCKFISWYKPINRACPQCASPYLVDKYLKTLGPHVACPNKECDYKEFPKAEAAAEPATN
ncbi:MAG TPA: type I DNA topoisomerase [bacterium]|nr:type I DNA topoisomerase [bacterium]